MKLVLPGTFPGNIYSCTIYAFEYPSYPSDNPEIRIPEFRSYIRHKKKNNSLFFY